MKNKFFSDFIDSFKDCEPILVESIKTAFNTIFESSNSHEELETRISQLDNSLKDDLLIDLLSIILVDDDTLNPNKSLDDSHLDALRNRAKSVLYSTDFVRGIP